MRHSLWVSPLITQGVWEDIVGNNPSTDIHRNFMVERVSWLDAVLFCNQLSEKLGYEPVYQTPEDIRYFLSQDKTSAIVKQVICDFNRNGFRLMTEAEWLILIKSKNCPNNYSFDIPTKSGFGTGISQPTKMVFGYCMSYKWH